MATTATDVTLSVPDMSCQHCVNTIDATLKQLPGVEFVAIDLSHKTVHLRYNASQLSLEKVEAALDDAGYTVAQ
ncbi:MAG: heavy-metal-associated domain-containing protein [Chloroflexi bacterium]|nr:MAG: heavy-metal-associated domain-containing protein [Chloroflexota bacterium]